MSETDMLTQAKDVGGPQQPLLEVRHMSKHFPVRGGFFGKAGVVRPVSTPIGGDKQALADGVGVEVGALPGIHREAVNIQAGDVGRNQRPRTTVIAGNPHAKVVAGGIEGRLAAVRDLQHIAFGPAGKRLRGAARPGGGDAGMRAQDKVTATIARGHGMDVLEIGLSQAEPGRLGLGAGRGRYHDSPATRRCAQRAARSNQQSRKGRR